MSRRETSSEIDDAAAAWAARVDRSPLSAVETRELEAWLAGDRRRLGAYGKARAVTLHTERARALGAGYDPQAFTAPKGPSRRLFWLGGGAAAAGAVLTAGLVLSGRGERFRTAIGEVRLAPLEDGSVITLNTETQVAVAYTRSRRGVRLLAGEALFDVAKHPGRPFVVEAGDTQVRAVGTSFTVRRLADGGVRILVLEGVVEVRRRNAAASTLSAPAGSRPGPGAGTAPGALRAGANSKVLSDAQTPLRAANVGQDAMDRELAWRQGMIAFEGETLFEAAREFARYSPTRIVIDDPAVGTRTVTGLFSASNPAGFAQAVADSFDLKAQVSGDEVRITR